MRGESLDKDPTDYYLPLFKKSLYESCFFFFLKTLKSSVSPPDGLLQEWDGLPRLLGIISSLNRGRDAFSIFYHSNKDFFVTVFWTQHFVKRNKQKNPTTAYTAVTTSRHVEKKVYWSLSQKRKRRQDVTEMQ